jgi:hypothetical protein
MRSGGMEGVFWYGLGILTGMAALPWVQRLVDRARRTLLELELAELSSNAAPDEQRRRP